jgi:uncharacterized protein (DUF2164 family)
LFGSLKQTPYICDMEITINIPDGVLNRMKELKITDKNIQKEMVIDFINDSLDSHYANGMFDKFKKWTLKNDNVEVYLAD